MVKICFSLLIGLVLICGCGDDLSEDSPPPDPNTPGNVDLSGQWEGTLTYENGGSERANFVHLSQNGTNISGIHELFSNGASAETDDVSGTVTNSTVTISAIYRSPDSADYIELAYEGTVDDNVFSGSLHVTGSTGKNPNINQRGTFTFTKVGGDNPTQSENISGVWQGMMATAESGQYDIVFDLADTDGRISGEFTYTSTQSGQTNSTETMIGTVDNSTVTINVTLYDTQSNAIELTFDGMVSNGSYDGILTITSGDVVEEGTFTTTKARSRKFTATEYPLVSDKESRLGVQYLLEDLLRSESIPALKGGVLNELAGD